MSFPCNILGRRVTHPSHGLTKVSENVLSVFPNRHNKRNKKKEEE
jgi:hypothetical protein